MSAPHASPLGAPFEVHQEPDVIAPRRLVQVSLLAIGVGLVAVLFSAVLLETNTGGIRSDQGNRAAQAEIAHVLQTPILGEGEGQELRAAQRAELSRYRWLDRDAGVAAIPIERAMEIYEREQAGPGPAKGAP